uniref:Transposase of ISCARN53, ISNCY family IS1202 group n=2 Tax=mine drainage metagenome TaxID=410659 RepID=E6PE14_9ZZZZ
MSKKELSRLQTAQRVLDRSMSVAEAATILGLSTRQVKRLTRRLRSGGAESFASPRRSRPPNNAFDASTRARVLDLAQAAYVGFGPTFLAEKLAERDGIAVNRETLRQWLIAAQLHRPRRRRHQPRPLRERRARVGELIQADGSPHRWFEERGGACTLLLYVDDATTTILGGLFAEHETSDGYFELFERAFIEHGLPVALYTDKHSVFRINNPGSMVDDETHVQRALRELDVELICANSPQAKGRVERANRSLQDRLVKELRLAGISTIAAANAFLPGFLAAYNQRFAIAPREATNAHRSANVSMLAAILTKRYQRVLTSELTFQLHDKIYAIDPSPLHRLRKGMRITINLPRTGIPEVLHNEHRIITRFVGVRQRTGLIVASKELNATVDHCVATPKSTAHTPPKTHPWRVAARLAQAQKAARGHL